MWEVCIGPPMKLIFGFAIAIILLVLFLVNGLLLLLSPTRWWELPRIVRLSGTLRQDMLRSARVRVQLRVFGFLMAAFAGWILLSVLGPRPLPVYEVHVPESYVCPLVILISSTGVFAGTYRAVRVRGGGKHALRASNSGIQRRSERVWVFAMYALIVLIIGISVFVAWPCVARMFAH